jgi:hypothetical protein
MPFAMVCALCCVIAFLKFVCNLIVFSRLKFDCLPSNSFASFDAHKVREFYLNDFSSSDLLILEIQLDNYIDDNKC